MTMTSASDILVPSTGAEQGKDEAEEERPQRLENDTAGGKNYRWSRLSAWEQEGGRARTRLSESSSNQKLALESRIFA